MARAALKWSATELAREGAIGYATVARFESGQTVQPDSIKAMRQALERGGVEFISAGATVKDGKGTAGVGVRLRG